MHTSIDIDNLLLCAVFAALGVTIPILFHILGIGYVFLPMFLPLAIGAFFMSIKNALILGAVTPLASALLTGMPPMYPPIAFIMAFDLAIFCVLISMLCHKTKLPVLAVLLIALLAERLLQTLLYLLVMPLFGVPAAAFSIYNILKVMPGIILMIVVVPLAVPAARKVISKYALRLFEHSHDGDDDELGKV
jgi:hypothetical protein